MYNAGVAESGQMRRTEEENHFGTPVPLVAAWVQTHKVAQKSHPPHFLVI